MPTELSEEEISSLTARIFARGVEPEIVIDSPSEFRDYSRDMGEPPKMLSRLLSASPPRLVIQPRSTEELSKTISALSREGIPFTPRGLGSTGLGGAVPVAGGAVVDLSKMSGIASIDTDSGEVQVSAGSTFFQIQSCLAPHGLELKSRPSNAFGTIGGWAAGGGMGLGSLIAGPVMQQVTCVDVVRPGGSIDHLSSSSKGFEDLFDTEGQLGIFASLTIETNKRVGPLFVQAMTAESPRSAMTTANLVLEHKVAPSEVTLLGKVKDHPGIPGEPEHELMLTAWSCAPGSVNLPSSTGIMPQQVARLLWKKRFFPMDSPLGPIFLASEALLPMNKVAEFIKAARNKAKRFSVPLLLHGHAVKSANQILMLVLFMFPCDPARGWNHLMLTPLAAILTALARRKGGRAYGVGIWNTPFAKKALGPKRMSSLLEQKKYLDPKNLCNPGKFFKIGTKAKALPVIMARGIYPSMLSMASGMGPMLKGQTGSWQENKQIFDRCVWCGACVTTCPAVAVTGSESVSARAKLSVMKRLHRDQIVTHDELCGALRCLACGQCQEVCARGLDLLSAWETLEGSIRERLDGDTFEQSTRDFANMVDTHRDQAINVALPLQEP